MMKALKDEQYFETARVNMVKNQLMTLDIHNQDLLNAFLEIPREWFYKDDVNSKVAYLDDTILEPSNLMLAPERLFRLLNALELKGSDKLLIVSAGFGYVAQVAAKMVGKVFATETDSQSKVHFMQNASKFKAQNIFFKSHNVSAKFLEDAPFDKIFVNEVLSQPPSDLLLSQLSDGGKMILMIKNKKGEVEYQKLTKVSNGEIFTENL